MSEIITTGFKFVAADLTTRNGEFSYLDALRSGDWLEATQPDPDNTGPCPAYPGDGLCVAHTVSDASSGGQSASTAVGLMVEYDAEDVLGEDSGKVRVRRLRIMGVFDPIHLIRLGLCADLRGADLRGADLEGANLRGADLLGANLRGAKRDEDEL
jgi:hypothetical protein